MLAPFPGALIRDEADFAAYVDYIPYNSVRHGFAKAILYLTYPFGSPILRT